VREVFETNVFGPLRLIRAVLPSMRQRGHGRIVNVSSGAAHPRVGVRLWGIYAASKAALHAINMELLKEVSALGIEVVLVEGGVGGHTRAWDSAREAAASFDPGSPYWMCERIAAAQIAAATSGPDQQEAVAEMIAEACTAANPAIRFPPEAQIAIDAVNTLPDEQFARLAAGETSAELYESVRGFWPLQGQVLGV
jgi:NAD(P)-dependent dehydrogenase (short-subunit alcohol dehydrogenase family)